MPTKISKEQFLELLDRYRSGRCTPDEHRELTAWIHALGEREEAEITDAERRDVEKRLWAHLQNAAPAKVVSLSWRSMSVGIAASLLLGISIAWFFRASFHASASEPVPISDANGWVELRTDDTLAQDFQLPDGSTITLFKNSGLKYNMPTGSRQRNVQLEGDAFFAVAHDEERPFVVTTGQLQTRVLGTSFKISSPGNNQKITVSVVTGRVSVSRSSTSDRREEVILTPNQKAVYDPSRSLLTATLVEKPVMARSPNGERIAFEQAPVSEILRTLEQQYQVPIEFDHRMLSRCRVTTAFSSEGFHERLSIVAKAIGASYRVEQTHVEFISTGCN